MVYSGGIGDIRFRRKENLEVVDVVEEVFGFELVAVSHAPAQIRRAAKPS